MKTTDSIRVTFDKSHILTIGKKMYKESINLIRELVNNSYDADATRVDIELSKTKIIVKDNGTGMDRDGLVNYFTIGSQEKKLNKVSKIFKRKVIGEIGIGKFSSLGATNRYELITKQGKYKARIIFDQNEWSKDDDKWDIPLELLTSTKEEPDGTTIILHDVENTFSPQEILERLRVSVPLEEEKFEVYINNKRVEPIIIEGRKFDIEIDTEYGPIEGNIILSDRSIPFSELGIICCVKNVMISRSLFGFEDFGHGTRKITGRINADFLDFTSDRDNFIINTSQYKLFFKLMREEVKKVIDLLRDEEDMKRINQSRKAIAKATKILKNAFKKAPEFINVMKVSVSKGHTGKVEAEDIEASVWQEKGKSSSELSTHKEKRGPRGEYNIIHIAPVTKNRVLKNIKTDLGFNYGFVEEGESGPPSYFYNDTIYVNRQHALYKKNSKSVEGEIRYLVEILIAEAVILTTPMDIRQYHERRIKLLTLAAEE